MKIRIHLIQMSTEHGIEQAVLPHLVKNVWQTRYEKQTQKIHLQAALFVTASHNATIIGYTPRAEFSELMTEFFKSMHLAMKALSSEIGWLSEINEMGFILISHVGLMLTTLLLSGIVLPISLLV